MEHLHHRATPTRSVGRRTADVVWDLSATAAPSLDGIRAIVHCAWTVAPRTQAVANMNIAGSLALLDEARRLDVPYVFISSMSASPTTLSRYGRSKHAVEAYVLEYSRGRVVRPGTIRDADGGIGMLGQSLKRLGSLPVSLRVTPTPDVPLVSLDRVVTVAADLALQPSTAATEVDLIDEWTSVDQLMAQMSSTPRASRSVTAPSTLVTTGCRVVRAAGVPGIRDLADSWLGLIDAGQRRAVTSP